MNAIMLATKLSWYCGEMMRIASGGAKLSGLSGTSRAHRFSPSYGSLSVWIQAGKIDTHARSQNIAGARSGTASCFIFSYPIRFSICVAQRASWR